MANPATAAASLSKRGTPATAGGTKKVYVSLAHKRSEAAAKQWGIDNLKDIARQARIAAGGLHDYVHKPK